MDEPARKNTLLKSDSEVHMNLQKKKNSNNFYA